MDTDTPTLSVTKQHAATRARISRLLAEVSEKLNLPVLECETAWEPYMACYDLSTKKVAIGHALAEKLTDFELGCVIAHELGHAQRHRWLRFNRLMPMFLLLFSCMAGVAWWNFGGAWGLLTTPFYILAVSSHETFAGLREERLADIQAVRYAGSASAYKETLLKVIVLQKVELFWELRRRLRLLS